MKKAQEAIDDFDYTKYGAEPRDYYAGLNKMDWSKYDQARMFVMSIPLVPSSKFRAWRDIGCSLTKLTCYSLSQPKASTIWG